MKSQDWNPDLYLKYDKERIQPSIDLVTRIPEINPSSIIDIGCGPGNSTQILYQRWPDSVLTGIDNSPAMIRKALNDYPNQKWLLKDAGNENIEGKFDIVFSNATIQWIPNHKELILKFYNLLNTNGILAVQAPLFTEMPVSKAIHEAVSNPTWWHISNITESLLTFHDVSFYYAQLSKYFSHIDVWVTDYFHVMNSHAAIYEMIQTTGLRPYLEQIENDTKKKEFESLVMKGIERYYPSEANGKVLFPFKRLFFIAEK